MTYYDNSHSSVSFRHKDYLQNSVLILGHMQDLSTAYDLSKHHHQQPYGPLLLYTRGARHEVTLQRSYSVKCRCMRPLTRPGVRTGC